MEKSTNSNYNLTLGRYILTDLGLYLSLYEHSTTEGDGLRKGCTSTMVNLSEEIFKTLNSEDEVTPEQYFMYAYIEELICKNMKRVWIWRLILKDYSPEI